MNAPSHAPQHGLALPAHPLSSAGRLRRLVAAAALGAASLIAPSAAQYQLVWHDEFDGTSLDLSKWEPMLGNGCPNLCGWGNNELQTYRAENATVGGGKLTITARRNTSGGPEYTSARLRTRNLGDWKYGRFEMRAKLPVGQGLWPAFWLLPTDSVYGVWAASGEIDVMEAVGQNPNRVLGTIHYGGTFPNNTFAGGSYTLPSGSFHTGFHDFAMEWDEFQMRWYVDGILYYTRSSWFSTGGPYPAPFNERFHLLLNLAIGGNLPGPPNGSTQFPQTFEVDYVRVYQEQELGDCVTIFDDMEHGDPFGNGYFIFEDPIANGGLGADFSDVPPSGGGAASIGTGWGSGGTPGYFGGFGRTRPQDVGDATHFDFWINPDPGQDYTIDINLQDDDDGNNSIPSTPNGADDEFQYSLRVSPTGPGAVSGFGWQRISIPLANFVDDNSFHTGGNGIFDPVPTSAGGNGQLVNVVLALHSTHGSDISFRTDRWEFSSRTSSIAGRIWSDENGDGLGAGEPGIAGVTVRCIDSTTSTTVGTRVTAASGAFSFPGFLAGSFEVRIDPATLPSGSTATFDPDGVSTPNRFELTLDCNDARTGQDFGYAPTPVGVNVCTPAVSNSTGAPGSIGAIGSPSVGVNDLTLIASSLPPGSLGYFLVSPNQGFIANPGGSTGNLCILPPFGRYLAFAGPVSPEGTLRLTVDLTALSQPSGPVAGQPGETWFFQLWHRDSVVGSPSSNFTDGLAVVLQ